MKEGYTLVELLAVIVIISVIGIITVPIATSYIEKSRVESYRISVENVIEVAKEYVAKEEENHDFPETGISVKKIEEKIDGKIISGRVKRNEEGVIVAENIYNGTYCASGSKNSLVVTKVTNETECGKLDITPPSLKVKANNVTNSSITVVAIAKDETEIKNYQYCIGDECSKEINQNHYTFTKLKSNKTYKIKVTVKNENSGKEGYDANTTETTQEIEATTKGVEAAKFKVSGTGYSGSKEVTIIYPEGNYEYRYEIRDIEDKNTKKTEIVKGDTTLKIQENCIIKAYVKTESEEIESEITVIGIDSIGPEVYVIMNNNWEKQKQISVIAIDTGSGLMSKAYSYDGGKKWTNNSKRIYSNNGVRVQLAVRDKLGNITTKYKICESIEEYNHNNCKETAGIIIDKVDNEPPTCKLTVINGTLGKNGWYRSDIKIGFAEVNDTQSGVKIQKIDRPTVTQEGIITIQGKVEDKVGNVGTCNIQVKIDKTKPSCGSWTGESTAWTKNVRTIQIGCNDSGSGCTTNQFTAKEYKTGTVKTENIGNIQIEDRAGNINTCSKNNVNVYVDHDVPICTSGGGSSSWTNNSRTLIGTCSDSGSGCQGNVSTTRYKDTNGENVSPGIVRDNAGNETTCNTVNIKIDTKKPTCTSSGGSDSWVKSATLIGTCVDTGSGCTGDASKTITKEGTSNNLSPGTVKDKAGNESTCPADQTVKIDKTPPTCSLKASGTIVEGSWYSSDVSVSFDKQDDNNKVVSSSINNKKVTTAGTTKVTGTVTDEAGNTGKCTLTVKKAGKITLNVQPNNGSCKLTGQMDYTGEYAHLGKYDYYITTSEQSQELPSWASKIKIQSFDYGKVQHSGDWFVYGTDGGKCKTGEGISCSGIKGKVYFTHWTYGNAGTCCGARKVTFLYYGS